MGQRQCLSKHPGQDAAAERDLQGTDSHGDIVGIGLELAHPGIEVRDLPHVREVFDGVLLKIGNLGARVEKHSIATTIDLYIESWNAHKLVQGMANSRVFQPARRNRDGAFCGIDEVVEIPEHISTKQPMTLDPGKLGEIFKCKSQIIWRQLEPGPVEDNVRAAETYRGTGVKQPKVVIHLQKEVAILEYRW